MLWKWIAFIAVSPLIRYVSRRRPITKTCHSDESESGVSPYGEKSLTERLKIFLRGFTRYMDIQVGLIPSHTVRNFIYRNIFCVRMDRDAIIYYGAEIRSHNKLQIGRGSIIGDKAILDARNGIQIGDNVNFSSNVSIWTEQHDHRDSWFRCTSDDSFRVAIGDRAWIGPNVIILHSVTIGEGAVVAAGSVVTKDVAPFSIVAGVPARQIGVRNKDLRYEFDGVPLPFL